MVVARPAHRRAVGEGRPDHRRRSGRARLRRARARSGGRRATVGVGLDLLREDCERSLRPVGVRRGCRMPARSTRCSPCSPRASCRRARTRRRRTPGSSRRTWRRRRRPLRSRPRTAGRRSRHAAPALLHLPLDAVGVGLERVEARAGRAGRAGGAESAWQPPRPARRTPRRPSRSTVARSSFLTAARAGGEPGCPSAPRGKASPPTWHACRVRVGLSWIVKCCQPGSGYGEFFSEAGATRGAALQERGLELGVAVGRGRGARAGDRRPERPRAGRRHRRRRDRAPEGGRGALHGRRALSGLRAGRGRARA